MEILSREEVEQKIRDLVALDSSLTQIEQSWRHYYQPDTLRGSCRIAHAFRRFREGVNALGLATVNRLDGGD